MTGFARASAARAGPLGRRPRRRGRGARPPRRGRRRADHAAVGARPAARAPGRPDPWAPLDEALALPTGAERAAARRAGGGRPRRGALARGRRRRDRGRDRRTRCARESAASRGRPASCSSGAAAPGVERPAGPADRRAVPAELRGDGRRPRAVGRARLPLRGRARAGRAGDDAARDALAELQRLGARPAAQRARPRAARARRARHPRGPARPPARTRPGSPRASWRCSSWSPRACATPRSPRGCSCPSAPSPTTSRRSCASSACARAPGRRRGRAPGHRRKIGSPADVGRRRGRSFPAMKLYAILRRDGWRSPGELERGRRARRGRQRRHAGRGPVDPQLRPGRGRRRGRHDLHLRAQPRGDPQARVARGPAGRQISRSPTRSSCAPTPSRRGCEPLARPLPRDSQLRRAVRGPPFQHRHGRLLEPSAHRGAGQASRSGPRR